jgi:hypothetical protein
LSGAQGWFDVSQPRMSGVWMHWSRLADLPLAAMITLLTSFLGSALAAQWAMVATPILLLGGFLCASAWAAWRCTGQWPPALIAAAGLALSPSVLAQFAPGRVDHHGLQLLLCALMLGLIAAAVERQRLAFSAGVIAAAMLAIATEAQPAVGAVLAGLALVGAAAPRPWAGISWRFGIAFAVGQVAAQGLTVPSARWGLAACDAQGLFSLTAALLGGGGLAIAACAQLKISRPAMRWAATLAVGGTGLAALWLLQSGCLTDPYAGLSPTVRAHWLNGTGEAASAAMVFGRSPAEFVGSYGYVLFAGLAALWAVVSSCGVARQRWLLLAAVLAVSTVVAAVQVRGLGYVGAAGAPALAWALAELLKRTDGLARALRVPARAGVLLGLSGFGPLFVSLALFPAENPKADQANHAKRMDCQTQTAFQAFAALPPGLAITLIDQGVMTLYRTPHSVLTGPYHRNTAALEDALQFWRAPAAVGRGIAAQRKARYVMVCLANPEAKDTLKDAPSGLLAQLAKGDVPTWLTPVPMPGSPLKVYRVID